MHACGNNIIIIQWFHCRVKDSCGRGITRQYTPISKLDKVGSFSVLIKVRVLAMLLVVGVSNYPKLKASLEACFSV